MCPLDIRLNICQNMELGRYVKMSKCRFGRVPGKCRIQSKQNVKWGPGGVDFGAPGKCQTNVRNVIMGSRNYMFWTWLTLFLRFTIFFDIFRETLQNRHFDICFYIFDSIFYILRKTLPNRHFDICLTFSGKSGKTPVTLASSGYGCRVALGAGSCEAGPVKRKFHGRRKQLVRFAQ